MTGKFRSVKTRAGLSARVFCLIVGFCSLATSLSANELSSLQFGVAPTLFYFDYQESGDSGEKLNTERGFIPGIRLSINSSYHKQRFEFAYKYAAAAVDYSGQTQAGAPHSTDTEEALNQIELQWMYQLIPDKGFTVGMGAAYWQWDRDIQAKNNISGLSEVYFWYEVAVRIGQAIQLSAQIDSELSLALLHTLSPKMEVDFTGFDGEVETLNLGEKSGLAVAWRLFLSNGSEPEMSLAFFYRRHGFGRSEDKAITLGARNGTIHEPESTTEMLGVNWTLSF